MILDAMQANQAEGVAMCDAHPDLEVFRLRLGKALNYEYNEDSQTGLFSRRDPREGEIFFITLPIPDLTGVRRRWPWARCRARYVHSYFERDSPM